MEGDLDLERNREQLKAIRRGEWSLRQLEGWMADKERHLEELCAKSELPPTPDHNAVKTLLLDCLEQHYGSLDARVVRPDELTDALRQISDIVRSVGPKIER